jgi:glycosyltransferase involved in cell wall biosynthesis
MPEASSAVRDFATTAVRDAVKASRRRPRPSDITLCHFTAAHTELKSRSLHRICAPLAQNGVRVRYVSPARTAHTPAIDFVWVPQPRSRVLRVLLNGRLLRELLRAGAQIYHFQDPELLPLALALKLLFRKHVIYDAYEDFPSMARESQSIPLPFRRLSGRIVELAEWLAAHCFDGILTADPLTLRRLARTGGSRKLVFSNFPNLEFFPAPSHASKPFDLVYRGGLSERAGTYDLLDAIRLLKLEGRAIRLLLIGYFDDVSAESSLRARIHSLGLAPNVELRGRIPHEEMAFALSQARIGVCPLRANSKFCLNIPVKVFEYWACGLPVVASDLPPIRPYFRTARAGLLFKQADAAHLASSLSSLLNNPDAAKAMGQNGRTAVTERFNNHGEVRRLTRFLAMIAGRANSKISGRH